MKRLFLILIGVGVLGFSLWYLSSFGMPEGIPVPERIATYFAGEGRGGVSKKAGIPVLIRIPKIGVNAEIEQVGLDAQGNMGVPKRVADTVWYKLGTRPGERGAAVIAGHLDTVTGAPSVFWDLKNLKQGDIIIVSDDKNKQYEFAVTEIKVYPFDKVPLKEIFGATDAKRLNLITCVGEWDKGSSNYSNRLVVYAKMQ